MSFNSQTIISYLIPQAENVAPKIFDILGKEVGTLVDSYQKEGRHFVILNGSKFSIGIYFYNMRAGDFIQTKKLIYMK